MNGGGAGAGCDQVLRAYQEEILRWNASINLVTRQSSAQAVPALCRQCEEALGLLLDDCGARLSGPGLLRYFDLGSGAGLPGVIWHLAMNRRGLSPRTTLVEPRAKRAWFLERVGALEGMPPYGVFAGRWGGGSVVGVAGEEQVAGALTVLISLKALRLKDVDVMAGLLAGLGHDPNPAAGPARVIIARFYPPDQVFPGDLGRALEFPEPGRGIPETFSALVHQGSRLLGPTSGRMATSLVFSEYARAS
ncbi:class I SAM-dependent methyltransferase [bacterium]|nr:class I SAM-dependent methyltransferase [bacterium]